MSAAFAIAGSSNSKMANGNLISMKNGRIKRGIVSYCADCGADSAAVPALGQAGRCQLNAMGQPERDLTYLPLEGEGEASANSTNSPLTASWPGAPARGPSARRRR